MVYQAQFGLDFSPSLIILRSFIHSEIVQSWDPHALMFCSILDSAPLGTEKDLVEFCLELLRLNKLSKLVAGKHTFIVISSIIPAFNDFVSGNN